jgi:peptidoglycan/xylan/chitin deacetylase (PgdA/CDA1 family)
MSYSPLTLCYHAVSEAWQRSLAIPQERLLRQMRLFRRLGFRPCTAIQAIEGRGRLLHVTFDDAFASIVPTLYQLHRAGVHHSVYVCTGFADRGGAPLAIAELAEEPTDELRTLTWDELRELASRGTEVYAHTVTHPHLSEIDDYSLLDELRTSRERLEDALNRPCALLAYPFGEHDARVRRAARQAGYDAAFALGRSGKAGDRFAVPRVGIFRGDSFIRASVKSTRYARSRFYSG